MDSKVDGNLVPQLRTCVREKGKAKALSVHWQVPMDLLLAGFLGKSAVSGFIAPDHSKRCWKRSPGKGLALERECRERGAEWVTTMSRWIAHGSRTRRLFCWSKGVSCMNRVHREALDQAVEVNPSVSETYFFFLYYSSFLASLVTHQENSWPATSWRKYNSA